MNIDNLESNAVVVCQTVNECESIALILHKNNMKWRSCGSYLSFKPWEDFGVPFHFYPKIGTWDSGEKIESKYTQYKAGEFL